MGGKEAHMRLTPPKNIVWFLSLILVGLGIVAHFVAIPFVSDHQFWFMVVGWALLFLGNLFKGF